MTIVYLYTALCTVGGADRSIIQKANYLADEMHQDVFIITDSQKERPPVFPYNPQIQISAESETKRSIFREKDKTKRSKKESAQHSKSRNKSFVMTSVSAL